MTKLKLSPLLFAAMAVLSGYAGWTFFVRDSWRSYFVEHSGIDLPSGVTNTFHFTEFEYAFTSHYTLPARAGATFAQENHFATTPPADWEPIFQLTDLPVPWNEIPTSGTLLYLTGADSSTAWDAVFHLESGSLWTSIYYAMPITPVIFQEEPALLQADDEGLEHRLIDEPCHSMHWLDLKMRQDGAGGDFAS